MPQFNHGDIDIYYEVHGAGTPLVLVAGLASDSQSWHTVIDAFATQFQVIVFDNRGVGRTQPQDSQMSIPLVAEDCIALIKHLGLNDVQLLGHSMGSFIAMECAARYPEYIKKLVLAGSSYYFSERNSALASDWVRYRESGMDHETWFRNLFYWLFKPAFFEHPINVKAALEAALHYPHPQSVDAFRNQVNASVHYHLDKVIPRVETETFVIGGELDLLFPVDDSKKLAELLPHATSVIIPQAAHSIHIDAPAEFIDAVQNFLAE